MRRLSLFLRYPLLRPSSLLLVSLLPALSFLPLPLPLAPLRARRLAFPPFCAPTSSLTLSVSHSRARARNRACGCARSCLVVSLPRLASPYLPTGATASRVIAARYREFLRLLATRQFLPWRHDRKFDQERFNYGVIPVGCFESRLPTCNVFCQQDSIFSCRLTRTASRIFNDPPKKHRRG